jgi:hypothetical protein
MLTVMAYDTQEGSRAVIVSFGLRMLWPAAL